MLFYTSDIKVMATIVDSIGQITTIEVTFHYATRGLFKHEMSRQLLKDLNSEPRRYKIIKVYIH